MLQKERKVVNDFCKKNKTEKLPEQQKIVKKRKKKSPPTNGNQFSMVFQHWGIATALANEYRNIPKLEFEDILQQARIGLTKAATRYDANKGTAFSTYAWRVIRNDLNSLYTKQQRHAVREIPLFDKPPVEEASKAAWENVVLDHKTNVLEEIRRRETRSVLLQAVSNLPERQRKVIHGVLSGKDHRTIGRQLGFSEVSAKTLVSRAYQNSLKNLKLELEKLGFHFEQQHLPQP